MFIQKELITDLDLLVSQVLNPNSRQYALEAIACFRAGSYRAAILSTWVALTYDLIHKIRDIASIEGGSAQLFIETFDTNVENETLDKLLKVEREILKVAKDFELISNREFYELEKLRSDRHRCAHPSFSSEDDLFQPSPEQVRFNLVNALSFVLTQKPIQGKKAIERIIGFTKSANFPEDYQEAKKLLESQYFRNTKQTIIFNVCKILIKELIRTDWLKVDPTLRSKYLFVLKAIFEADSKSVTPIFTSVLNACVDVVDEFSGLNCMSIVWVDLSLWNSLNAANRQLVKSLIGRGVADRSGYLLDCLSVVELADSVQSRLSAISDESLVAMASENPNKILKPYLLERFCEDPNFTKTRDFGNKLAGSYSKFLSASDVKRILASAVSSNQIYGYFYADQIMKDLFNNTRDRLLSETADDWRSISSSGRFNELRTYLIAVGVVQDTTT